MGVSVTYFGNQKVVFANQDDGIFSAVPITFDSSVLTLETYTANNRTFVKAGSLVKSGSTVKGITAEEYELTSGPINGRVVLEGYAYVEALTELAATNLSSLPKIVPIPYGKIIFEAMSAMGNKVVLKAHGTVWTSAAAAANFTVTDGSPATNAAISAVARDTQDNSLMTLTIGASESHTLSNGVFKITAVAAAAVVGSTGKVIQGLPITITVKDGEVCL